MALVDEQGRLFGRVNLLDAIMAVVIVGLVPLAYSAYLLFRTPEPRLTAVEPSSLILGPNLRVSVKGENFRPYMRVSFNSALIRMTRPRFSSMAMTLRTFDGFCRAQRMSG